MTVRKIILVAAAVITVVLSLGFTIYKISDSEKSFYLNGKAFYRPGTEVSFEIYGPTGADLFKIKIFRIKDHSAFITKYYAHLNKSRFDIWLKGDLTIFPMLEEVRSFDFVPENTSWSWNSNSVKAGIFDKSGLYVIQVAGGDQVGYLPVNITPYILSYKNSGSEILAFLTDPETGKFIEGADFSIYIDGKESLKKRSGEDGIAFFGGLNISTDTGKELLVASKGDDIVFSNPYFFVRDDKYYTTKGYIYTNQPVYRPGSTVKYKATMLQYSDGDHIPLKDREVSITVRNPEYKEVQKRSMKTDAYGSLWGEIDIPAEAKPGTWYIQMESGGVYFSKTFDIEEYKKPEYFVTVKTDKNNYSYGDKIEGQVSADYYFGSPVKEAKVTVKVFKQRYYIPWWHDYEYSWYYDAFSYRYWDSGRELINQTKGEFGDDGKFSFSLAVSKDDKYDNNLIFVAEVTDNSGRMIPGSTTVMITRADFRLSLFTDKYYLRTGEELTVNFKTEDFSFKPVSQMVSYLVNRTNYNRNNSYEETILKDSVKTDTSGRASFKYIPKEAGYYRVIATAVDSKGRIITETTHFYVSEEGNPGYGYSYNEIQIITGKDVYKQNDTLSGMIILPEEGVDFLITLEQNGILSYKKYSPTGKISDFRFVLGKEHSPGIKITVSALKGDKLMTAEKMVGVIRFNNKLNIEVMTSKPVFEPGDSAGYTLKVTDESGNPVKNVQLGMGVTDEAVYAIKADDTPDINKFFNQLYYSYIALNSTAWEYNYSPMSRRVLRYELDPGKHGAKDQGVKTFVSGRLELLRYEMKTDVWKDIYIVFASESSLYSAPIDSLFNFELKNIPAGNYDVAVFTGDNSVKFISEFEITPGGIKGVKFTADISDLLVKPVTFETESVSADEAPAPPVLKKGEGYRNEDAKTAYNMNAEEEVLASPKLRSEFRDAAFWNPEILTGEDGTAKISFLLPDNLTTWRAVIKGVSPDGVTGETLNKVISRKDLMIRVESPRFFREGDTVTVISNIHNYLSKDKNVKTSLYTDSFEFLSVKFNGKVLKDKELRVDVPADNSVKLEWKFKVKYSGDTVTVFADALTDEKSDAVKLKYPVLPEGVQIFTGINAVAEKQDNSREIVLNIPADVNLETIKLKFNSSPTIGTTILKALDDLVDYPYGCVEQTMSRFLPAIIVTQTYKKLNIEIKSETLKKLPVVVKKGLERLYDMQHGDGGWGWWKNDQTNLFMTAYVVFGLHEAKEAGYMIPDEIFSPALSRLGNMISESKIMDTELAFAVYAYNNAAGKNKLYESALEKITGLEKNPYSKALAGLAYGKAGDKDKMESIAAGLIKTVTEAGNLAFWGDNEYYSWRFDNVQTTATVLKLLIMAGYDTPLIQKGINWLLLKQKGFSWYSTKQTAVVLFTLTDYLLMKGDLEADYSYSIDLNGQKITGGKFDKSNIFEESSPIIISGKTGLLKHGKNILTISKIGTGNLYLSGNYSYFSKTIPSGNEKLFAVEKEVRKLTEKATINGIVYVKSKPEEIKSGDMIFIKLRVKLYQKGLEYLMAEDIFPSGFEYIKDDQELNVEGEYGYNDGVIYKGGMWYRKPDREVRDSKVSFFLTYPQEEMEFWYILRSQSEGHFKTGAAEVSLMYYPDNKSYSQVYELIVK